MPLQTLRLIDDGREGFVEAHHSSRGECRETAHAGAEHVIGR